MNINNYLLQRPSIIIKTIASLLGWLLLTTLCAEVASSPKQTPIALGQRIYQHGTLAAGEPTTALVQGDVPVDGRQFSCMNCHRRSGMGAIEGDRIIPPVTGAALYHDSAQFWTDIEGLMNATPIQSVRPPSLPYRKRPAYTDETLAQAIRHGRGADGQPLDRLMPRYPFSDEAMAALIAYLKTLSAQFSPGVTSKEIYLATVITEEVSAQQQKAMLGVLNTYFREKNAQTRGERQRIHAGPFYHAYKNKAYRQWQLIPWVLTGTPEHWQAQLHAYYQQQPVFALISGISTQSWQPIHDFCAHQQLPCLLPNTDWPTVDNDFYALYFSKGLALEALAIAQYIDTQTTQAHIVQISKPNIQRIMRILPEYYQDKPAYQVSNWLLTQSGKQQRIAEADWVIFWLTADDIIEIVADNKENQFMFSSTLLNGNFAAIPVSLRQRSRVAHLYTLPKVLTRRQRRLELWLNSRGMKWLDKRIQAQTYFACLVMSEGLMHIQRYFYRDYLLDALDHAENMGIYSIFYPRLSFGPGQRYLAKGSYIVALAQDGSVIQHTWIVP